MRHPAAPTIIAVLLGLLLFIIAYHMFVDDGHHEGNPHPDDVPKKEDVLKVHGEESEEESESGQNRMSSL